MADKSISELVAASQIGPTDLFVAEQGGVAKKVTGQTFENWLLSFANGHGGIHDITYTPPVSPSLVGTMTVTLADETVYTIPVANGNGIADITWSSSGTAGDGQTHTMTILRDDGTTNVFTLQDGVKGDTGDAWYTDFKWSSALPTSDSDMSIVPDSYIGVYYGLTPVANLHYSDYTWFEYKGAKGDTGDAAEVLRNDIAYQWASDGTTTPSGTWSPDVPARVAGANFLWVRVTLAFNSGPDVVFYAVSHYGEDGLGAVATVNLVSPTDGNVTLKAEHIQTADDDTVQTALDNVKTIPRPNLLENSYFVGGGSQQGNGQFPINQRGQTVYTTNGYCIDRWVLTSGRVEITGAGLKLNGTISQILEQSIGLPTTASALLSDGTIVTPTYNDTTHTLSLSAANKTVVAVKLEVGPNQTLAHKDGGIFVLNEVPDFSTEQLKCLTSPADASDVLAGGITKPKYFAVTQNTDYLNGWYAVGNRKSGNTISVNGSPRFASGVTEIPSGSILLTLPPEYASTAYSYGIIRQGSSALGCHFNATGQLIADTSITVSNGAITIIATTFYS